MRIFAVLLSGAIALSGLSCGEEYNGDVARITWQGEHKIGAICALSRIIAVPFSSGPVAGCSAPDPVRVARLADNQLLHTARPFASTAATRSSFLSVGGLLNHSNRSLGRSTGQIASGSGGKSGPPPRATRRQRLDHRQCSAVPASSARGEFP